MGSYPKSGIPKPQKGTNIRTCVEGTRFDGAPFVMTSDGCQDGFSRMLAQCFEETRPGGKTFQKLHPIAFTSKRTSAAEARYKPFLLEFAALKFAMDKFDSIIWGFPVEIETDCQALWDVIMNDDLNATHSHWLNGILTHQIIDARHVHCNHIRTQLLDQIYNPLLNSSIAQALMECARCKNFGNMHIHALLAPIT